MYFLVAVVVLGVISGSALLFLFVVAAASVFMATKPIGRTLSALLGLGLLILVVMRFGSDRDHVQVVEKQSDKSAPARLHVKIKSSANSGQTSTEDMWEHLNRPRIVLDSVEKKSGRMVVYSHPKESDAKESEAKEVVAEPANPAKAKGRSQQARSVPHRPELIRSGLNRPDWVDNSPKRVGNVYRVVVASGPYKTEAECYQSLEPMLGKVVNQRLEQLMPGSSPFDLGRGVEPGHGVDLGQLDIGMEYVWRDICTEAWVETSAASFGEMKQVHVLMQFGDAQDKQLRQALRGYLRTGRVATVGTAAGAVVAGLALLYGLLQADTVTKGYYSKRLFFGVPAAIIGLILLFIA